MSCRGPKLSDRHTASKAGPVNLRPYLTPKYVGMRRDLERFLHDYSFDRAHNGIRTLGRTPAETLKAAVRL
ncbi:MAG: hypothetical protein E6I00_07075 [Chloroflexi bacterium]|nr:MAG: hypothetical protein E6I96_00370 [Chloroflexota bacterium]TMG12188.1 MAG: hypothetical protein E6I00_07075 [Chloroflexota bacterium]